MRTLCLLRHAKSSWDDPTLADHARPLAPRGIHATPVVADHLQTMGLVPQVVLCSSARRTVQTLELLGDAIPADCDVRIEDELYHGNVDALLDRLRALPDTVHTAMLIGHNPDLQHLALVLAGSGGAQLGRLARKFPTAAAATLDADVAAWSDLSGGCARLRWFTRPRDLDAPR
jgi:phosphohistidine phosphatase